MATPIPCTPYVSNFDQCYPFSNTCVTIQLAASTALAWTVPGSSGQIFRASFSISTSADAWVCNGATAAVPTSGAVNSTPYQQRIDDKMCLFVKGGDSLSFIGTSTPQIGVSLMLVQST